MKPDFSKYPDHPWACELAKLGLAAWRAQPESFPKIHKLLFSRPILTAREARREITEIIPKEEFEKALTDPWINELIKANTYDYHTLSFQTGIMPKLRLFGTQFRNGGARSAETFISEMETAFGL